MATLVLSTVGTALGGPLGGAIGALIGQSFDQQLLGPARRGPRLGDLSVQTSSYGTQIPRVYGAMRVAGSVIWATDLVESEQTSGAKGQPDLIYSYSVSLAVALSSRPVTRIGRIWADGQLLRGVEGDFKVPTTFRFYDGSEGQAIDPLIASAEGIDNTPAYRGLAYVVFENLELATYGNRIPFMTFEVIAGEEQPDVGTILADASGSLISVPAATDQIVGYAAYGKSIAAAVEPLVDCFDVELFDDGARLRGSNVAPMNVLHDELGCGSGEESSPAVARELAPVRAAPSTIRVTYYDADRDYLAGEARARSGDGELNEVQQELPAVLAAEDAKSLVQSILARACARRERISVKLPPDRLSVEPGARLNLEGVPGTWTVESCTLDSFVSAAELRPTGGERVLLAADAGRAAISVDVVAEPATLAMIDIADPAGAVATSPTLMIAASAAGRWTQRSLTVDANADRFVVQSAAQKAVLGRTLTPLQDADPHLIDCVSTVDVQLVDPEHWLTSCDGEAFAAGANLAVVGSEVVQFGDATPLGGGRFRLAKLVRGRSGSDWAIASHVVGETFCMLSADSLRSVPIPIQYRGAELALRDGRGGATDTIFVAESMRPLSPVGVGAERSADGGLALSWTRRSRCGFAWLDEVDAPLGETSERYAIALSCGATTFEYSAAEPRLDVSAADLAMLGRGQATIAVRQIGDWAASRPAEVTINLP